MMLHRRRHRVRDGSGRTWEPSSAARDRYWPWPAESLRAHDSTLVITDDYASSRHARLSSRKAGMPLGQHPRLAAVDYGVGSA